MAGVPTKGASALKRAAPLCGCCWGYSFFVIDVLTDIFTGAFPDIFTDVFPDVVTGALTGAFADVFTGLFTDVFIVVFTDVLFPDDFFCNVKWS